MWYELKSPDYVGDYSLGHSPVTDATQMLGRTIKTSLMDLTNDFKDLNYHLTFKVTNVTGKRAKTEFFGQALSRDFRRSQIRNHRSQVDGIFNITLKDKSRIRISTFVVTPIRAAHNVKKEVRAAIKQEIEEILSELSFPAFVNKLITYELRDELLPVAAEIFPIKILEISKVKVLRLPEDRQMQDISEIESPLEDYEQEEEEEDQTELTEEDEEKKEED